MHDSICKHFTDAKVVRYSFIIQVVYFLLCTFFFLKDTFAKLSAVNKFTLRSVILQCIIKGHNNIKNNNTIYMLFNSKIDCPTKTSILLSLDKNIISNKSLTAISSTTFIFVHRLPDCRLYIKASWHLMTCHLHVSSSQFFLFWKKFSSESFLWEILINLTFLIVHYFSSPNKTWENILSFCLVKIRIGNKRTFGAHKMPLTYSLENRFSYHAIK